MSIETLKKAYYENIEEISMRRQVAKEMRVSDTYLEEIESLIVKNKEIRTMLAEHYNTIRKGNNGSERFIDYYNRMLVTREIDEDGKLVPPEKFKLGVNVIDNEWLDGKGITRGCFVSIGADSGVGKTELTIMFMQSFAIQGRKTLFASLEMGDGQLFDNAVSEGKFDDIINSQKYHDNFFINFDCENIDDLAELILIANRDNGVDVFVIDSYLPIITNSKSSVEKMNMVSSMLDSMKRTLNITVILIAQWSRADSKDGTYDFSGGTSLKYMSDFVLFIEKFENTLKKNTMRKITCAKNRVFQSMVDNSIITDYDRETKKIVKIGDKDDPAVKKISVNKDRDGKTIRSLNF